MENAYKDSVGKENKGRGSRCGPCGKFIRRLLLSRILLPTKWECSAAMGLSFRSWNTWDCLIDHEYFL